MILRRPHLEIDVVSLFPSMFEGPLTESVIGRARDAGLIRITFHNLRKWSTDKRHAKVDDRPYGGGAGMVIQPEPVYQALKSLGALKRKGSKPWVVMMSPQGDTLNQAVVTRLSKRKRLIVICGHYEGIDERVMSWVDQEISMGDFILTGGEIPAMAMMDAIARLIPGVVGDPESVINESFSDGLLEHPHYTRPAVWRGKKVPRTLMSGNHKEIAKWRKTASQKQTKKKRPNLLKKI